MIVYSGTKTDFIRSVEEDTIALEVENNILLKMGRHTAKEEFRSWENSLQHMHTVLTDSEIPNNAGIAIEYNIPQTSKRVDFIISGYDENNSPCIVVVELKQWESLNPVDSVDALVETYTGGALRTVVHPSYQAWSYSALIKDYNQEVQDNNIGVFPCSFLHNYRRMPDDPIDDERYKAYTDEAPAFTKGEVPKLREYIKGFVRSGDNADLIYKIDGGRIRPSKSLQDAISGMLKGNREFFMIDDQKVAYEKILNLSMKCQRDGKKRTIIVKGGPGTGKSVIAVNLLAELTQRGQLVQYSSKNDAPRKVYAKKLKGDFKVSSIDNLFKGSGCYVDVESNIIDTILADEAHRLNEHSGLYHNQGHNQIEEIINASKSSVFFLDESQRVTMYDIGSEFAIENWADTLHSEVTKLELTSQFRCNGSDGYLAWLDDVLGIRETANTDLGNLDYTFKVCSSPNELVNLIKAKNAENHRSRVVAGYCWNWPKQEQNNPDFKDITIGDFSMSWNLGNYTFALDDESINQAGCIHTTQGLEFDYVGVIIGPDLRYINGSVVTDYTKRASSDQSIKGLKKLMKENPEEGKLRADEIIKNTYRTLMTRGMKGCYVYCIDSELADYLKSRLPQPIAEPLIVSSENDDEGNENIIMLPLIGEIAAGHEFFAEDEVEEWIPTDKNTLHPPEPGKYFYLRVNGDSMIGAGINDGDVILIRRMSNPRDDVHNRDIVACGIHGDRATLKTFYKQTSGVILQPQNPAYEPIFVPWEDFDTGEARIIGKMIK